MIVCKTDKVKSNVCETWHIILASELDNILYRITVETRVVFSVVWKAL